MKSALKRLLPLLFDFGILAAVALVRLEVWPRGGDVPDLPGVSGLPEGWWRVGSVADLLLYGPDAGDWAIQARAVIEGGALDNRRLPLYPHLISLMHSWYPDVVFAGHLVNHGVSLLAACLTYLVGKATSGRAAGAAAALLVAVNPYLIVDQQLFAVDPTFQLVCVVLLLTGYLASDGPRWAPALAGVCVGFAMSTHYIGMLTPALLLPMLVVRRDKWWFPPLGIALAAAAAAGVFTWMTRGYPPITWRVINVEYTVGVLSSVDRSDLLGHGLDRALPLIFEKLPAALRAFYADLSQILTVGGGFDGWPVVALGAWGLVGLGLPKGEGPWWRRWQWRATLWFGLFLIPMLGLEAAGAPDRYEHYAWPVLLLCLARGAVSVVVIFDDLVRRFWPAWPAEAIALAVTLGVAGMLVKPTLRVVAMMPQNRPGLHERVVGARVAEAFPGAGPIVTWSQEIRFYAHKDPCKGFTCDNPKRDQRMTCPEHLALECGSGGDLPYLIDERDRYGFADAPDLSMNAWVKEVGEVVDVIPAQNRLTTIYRIKKELLPRPSLQPALQPAQRGPPLEGRLGTRVQPGAPPQGEANPVRPLDGGAAAPPGVPGGGAPAPRGPANPPPHR